MPNLAEHQLRVAGVAMQICDALGDEMEVDRDSIVKACLLHDMGNIIKFRLDYFPEFLEPEGLDYWQKVQNEYIEKYGEDEHEATIKIIKELGLSYTINNLADQNRFSLLCKHRSINDLNLKIIHYADARVAPNSVCSYEERMNDAGKRYKNHKHSIFEEERQKLVSCGKEIEKQIFGKCKIKPEDITDKSVSTYIEKLKNFEI